MRCPSSTGTIDIHVLLYSHSPGSLLSCFHLYAINQDGVGRPVPEVRLIRLRSDPGAQLGCTGVRVSPVRAFMGTGESAWDVAAIFRDT